MEKEKPVGPHLVRVDGDTVLTRWIGAPELEHVRCIHQQFEEVLVAHGRLFVINDMRQSGLPSAQARKWIAEWGATHPVAAVVNIGASLPVRALQSLLIRAAGLLGKKPSIEVVHCRSEAEALAWLDARRRSLTQPTR
jgi:hypothetical protein